MLTHSVERRDRALNFYDFVIDYRFRNLSELRFIEASKDKADSIIAITNLRDFLGVMSSLPTPSYGGMRFDEAVRVGMRLVVRYEKYLSTFYRNYHSPLARRTKSRAT